MSYLFQLSIIAELEDFILDSISFSVFKLNVTRQTSSPLKLTVPI